MSRPARLAAFSVLVLFLGCRSAHAAGWWDYLEALSGPGPFKGYTDIFANLYCVGQEEARKAQGVDIAKVGGLKDGLFGRVTNGSITSGQTEPCIYFDITSLQAEADDRFPIVDATFYEFGLEYRVLRTVDFGFGAGALHLNAKPINQEAVSSNVLMLTPIRVTIMPLWAIDSLRKHPWTSILKVYFRQSFLVNNLDGTNFGVPASVFHERGEFVRSVGVIIDLTKAVRF